MRKPLKPKTISNRLKNLRQQLSLENAIHERTLRELATKFNELKSRCKHDFEVIYHPNQPTYKVCKICNLEKYS